MKAQALTIQYNGISHQLQSPAICINPDEKSRMEIKAIWDTGAQGTCITEKIVNKLNLKQTGVQRIISPTGPKTVPKYDIMVMLPNKVGINRFQANMVELFGADMLIGMDIITLGDFAVSNIDAKTTFSFRYPSLAKTDYVQLINAIKPAKSSKIGRNVPCPCGSGKKYKNCCGA